MDLTKLTSKEFNRIYKLLQEKEKLLSRIAEIDAALSGISTGAPRQRAKRTSASRGKLKEEIIETLKASPEGISAKDIAEKIAVPRQNLAAWFSSTGKKIPQIQKLGRGIYTWKENIEPANEEPSASET